MVPAVYMQHLNQCNRGRLGIKIDREKKPVDVQTTAAGEIFLVFYPNFVRVEG